MTLLMMVAVAGCGQSATQTRQVYDVYLAADNGRDTVTFKYLEYFGHELEKRSNGRIRAHYYSDVHRWVVTSS